MMDKIGQEWPTTDYYNLGRVHVGHGKPGILEFHFPGLENHGILVQAMESNGNVENDIDYSTP